VLKKATRDVVRVRDVLSLVDVAGVQQYVCNRAMVVYLKKWPGDRFYSRRSKQENLCVACKQRLKSPYKFCSIGCKVCRLFFSSHETTKVWNLVTISLSNCYIGKDHIWHDT